MDVPKRKILTCVIVTCATKSTTLTFKLTFFNGTGTGIFDSFKFKIRINPQDKSSYFPILLQKGILSKLCFGTSK